MFFVVLLGIDRNMWNNNIWCCYQFLKSLCVCEAAGYSLLQRTLCLWPTNSLYKPLHWWLRPWHRQSLCCQPDSVWLDDGSGLNRVSSSTLKIWCDEWNLTSAAEAVSHQGCIMFKKHQSFYSVSHTDPRTVSICFTAEPSLSSTCKNNRKCIYSRHCCLSYLSDVCQTRSCLIHFFWHWKIKPHVPLFVSPHDFTLFLFFEQ